MEDVNLPEVPVVEDPIEEVATVPIEEISSEDSVEVVAVQEVPPPAPKKARTRDQVKKKLLPLLMAAADFIDLAKLVDE